MLPWNGPDRHGRDDHSPDHDPGHVVRSLDHGWSDGACGPWLAHLHTEGDGGRPYAA
ncbi:hypothetical protein ACFU9X_47320 [Streptomyces atratus]|uniref:hypothetical protein n=1 Tax=Streptomyces atratus TaxID=1893 RepID=UPI0036B6D6A4